MSEHALFARRIEGLLAAGEIDQAAVELWPHVREAHGRADQVARTTGVHRATVYRWIKAHTRIAQVFDSARKGWDPYSANWYYRVAG